MSEPVSLKLIRNKDQKQIEGDSSITAMSRANTIECLFYQDGARAAVSGPSNGVAHGRRVHEPIVIRKRIDRSTPGLAEAMTRNLELDGEFCFYRPNPNGTGKTEMYYSVKIKKARIASIIRVSPDASNPSEGSEAPFETISFVFHTIIWEFAGGKVAEDAWDRPE